MGRKPSLGCGGGRDSIVGSGIFEKAVEKFIPGDERGGSLR